MIFDVLKDLFLVKGHCLLWYLTYAHRDTTLDIKQQVIGLEKVARCQGLVHLPYLLDLRHILNALNAIGLKVFWELRVAIPILIH